MKNKIANKVDVYLCSDDSICVSDKISNEIKQNKVLPITINQDAIRKVDFWYSYRTNSFANLGSMIYTDGKLFGEISVKEEAVNGFFINKNVYDENANTLVTSTVKLRNAHYVIYVFYKDKNIRLGNGRRGVRGCLPVICDIKLVLFDNTNEVALNEAKETLELLRSCYLKQELDLLESNKSSVVYTNDGDVHQLKYSKYNKHSK